MHLAPSNTLSPSQLLHLLRRHVLLWLLPAVAIAAAVGVYAAVHQATWEASQALIVRNEASGAEKGPGKFSYPEEMKTVQETILEVVRSRSVLEAALREVGPPADCRTRRTDFLAVSKNGRIGNPSYAGIRLAHRPRHRRSPQERQARSAQGGRVRQDRGLLSGRAGGRPRPLRRPERGDLQATPHPIPEAPRRQGPEHGRRADQDRPPGQGRPGRGHRRLGGHRAPPGQRPGRTPLDAGHGLQRQRPAPQRRGHPRPAPRERRGRKGQPGTARGGDRGPERPRPAGGHAQPAVGIASRRCGG